MVDSRRQYKSGSVYLRASDGRWVGTLEAGETIDGRRRRVTVSAKTEALCKKAVEDKRRELIRNGTPLAGVETRTTVAQWAERWQKQTGKDLRPKSWATDASTIKRWIVPHIGKIRLDKLEPKHLIAVTDAMIDAGLSTSSALRAHATMRKMFRDAVVMEKHQIADGIFRMGAPKKAARSRGAIEISTAIELLEQARRNGTEARWMAALLQGMRQGECLGLTWGCIDFGKLTIDVSWQLQELPYRHGCETPCRRRFGGDCPHRTVRIPQGYEYRKLQAGRAERLYLVRPKTARGQRVLPMVPWLTAALIEWRDRAPVNPDGLVWANPDGAPRLSTQDRDEWYALQDSIQVANLAGTVGGRWMLHEARHTTATLLLEEGVDYEVIKAIIGHSDIEVTRGYQHVSTALARKALESVAKRLQIA